MIDLTGQLFGRWRVLSRAENDRHGNARWLCECTCPQRTRRIVRGVDLRSGHARSCGCLQREVTAARNTTHGLSKTPEYKVWLNMIKRCTNPNHPEYKNYGGRGIKVCDRWLESFENFFADTGLRPSPKLTLERIDNDGDYEPENWRWATRKEQARNIRPNRMIPFNGEMLCVTEWAERVGIKANTLLWRLDRGWSIERALTQPVRGRES